MRRRIVIAFLLCQILGELFAWMSPHHTGPEGPWLWVASVVLLLPGDLIATWFIEKAVWNSGVTPEQMQFIKMLVEFAINAAVWVAIASPWIRIRPRSEGRNAETPGS